jgi:hypothetical protein
MGSIIYVWHSFADIAVLLDADIWDRLKDKRKINIFNGNSAIKQCDVNDNNATTVHDYHVVIECKSTKMLIWAYHGKSW